MRSRPIPPYPEFERKPPSSFGRLDAGLLHDEWLGRLGPGPVAVMAFLALALGMPRNELDRCLDRLRELGLVAQRPWKEGHDDGVWQLLPLPQRRQQRRRTPLSYGL